MKVPCKECITLAVCRHKSYSKLMECDIIRGQLYNTLEDKRLLMIDRKNNFRAIILDLDKSLGSSHTSSLVSREGWRDL
jgi:hypothetical protein